MPKKHHFVPVTYLRQFTGPDGKLVIYRKDAPDKPFRQRPESAGFERHYYSQTDGSGNRDDSTLEQTFSVIEGYWPRIWRALHDRQTSFPDAPNLIPFLALMRVRGPAFRDAVELQLADLSLADMHVLLEQGELPPPPSEIADRLHELRVAIDPHMSLLAMANIMRGVGEILGGLSYQVIHNETGLDFITSDNPVMYYDSRSLSKDLRPYIVDPAQGNVELLVPISRRMMLRGRSKPVRPTIGHKALNNPSKVRAMNRVSARFAYREIYASGEDAGELILQHSALSPVPEFSHLKTSGGRLRFSQMVFGPRPEKVRW